MNFNNLNEQITTNMDIFQPTKVDTFIIKAYKIVTDGTILNSYHITTSSSSPLNNSNSGNVANDQDETDTDALNNNNNTGKVQRRKKKGSTIHPQYSKTFVKLSKIYNSLLSNGLFGDVSTSPKSDIELFQRFQQILKELELNFEMSPYSKYFNKVSETLFQVKEDNELTFDDPFWITLTDAILNYYNPRTGKIINQGRKKNVVKRNVSAGKNTNASETTNNNDFFNVTNNMLTDPTLSLQLQRKLQMIPQDVSSRSLNGYYTQPTSPGSGGFPFNLGGTDDDDILGNNFNNDTTGIPFNSNDGGSNNNNNNSNNSNNNNNNGNIPLQNGNNNFSYMNHKKRRSLGSLTLDESAMDDLLRFTNINKKQRTPQSFNNIIDDFRFPSNGVPLEKVALTKMSNVEVMKDGDTETGGNTNVNSSGPLTTSSLPVNGINTETGQTSASNSAPNTNMTNITETNSNGQSVIEQVSNNNDNVSGTGILTTLDNDLVNSGNKQNVVDSMNSNDINPISMNNNNMSDSGRVNTMQITPESTMNSNTANINLSSHTGESRPNCVGASNITSSAFSGQHGNGAMNNSIANAPMLDALFQELHGKYEAIMIEKDKRIGSLEAELESQRQETMWLRKMLIEDMGYIRNFLQNTQT
ncbi:similar to Saccharomyces cerevisiae YNL199C GCR2 Transcriptional activator of genes involved in glycolysis [Maudiozyma saulgeensis]|uniref:Similar to Saccharomyces cerevisiae YNL199C GCR2 Transcriptional activator of genes involved in glycolysis n=1 Tax=Maudiozyma saulgeensis TaxID=1789683 RepID=A0A1X7R6S5_9SACH|nr:similar to Saccharomyces cerevisiae YNL199C GCR2 Transcriptional activator of genes involved in glycolysis [Kazachstania saulgeensis]